MDQSQGAARGMGGPPNWMIAAAALAVWAIPFFMVVPGDYTNWLLPWYEHIVHAGPVAAFAHPFSNYSPPYLYLLSLSTLLPLPPLMAVKLVAVVGGLWLVYAVYRLAGTQAAAFSLFLPTVIINVPVLAQADSFWVAPCVLAVCAALRRDTLWTAVWAGVGFAFKAQAIFIAPFVLGTIMRAPLRHWLAPVGVYLAAMLPAWLAGWPTWDLAMVYIRQERWAPPGASAFVSTAPNLWAVLRLDHEWAATHFWIGFLLAGLATLVYLRWFKRFHLVAGAALSAAMLPFLLPGMHERFFALAEVLTFCIAWRTERFAIAAMMQTALIVAIAAIELNSYFVLVLGACIELWAIALLTKRAVRPRGDCTDRRVALNRAST